MSLQCYRCQGYCHRQSECPTKVSPGKDQKSLMPVGQSNQKKTRAMVAKSHEDGDTKQFRLAADGNNHSGRCAVGQCLPGFPVLQSDVCQLPHIPCDNW